MSKIIVTDEFKEVLKQLNKAISVYEEVLSSTEYSDIKYKNLLKQQLILEKAKLELLENQEIEFKLDFGLNSGTIDILDKEWNTTIKGAKI